MLADILQFAHQYDDNKHDIPGNVYFNFRDAICLKLNHSVQLILYWRMTSWVVREDTGKKLVMSPLIPRDVISLKLNHMYTLFHRRE